MNALFFVTNENFFAIQGGLYIPNSGMTIVPTQSG